MHNFNLDDILSNNNKNNQYCNYDNVVIENIIPGKGIQDKNGKLYTVHNNTDLNEHHNPKKRIKLNNTDKIKNLKNDLENKNIEIDNLNIENQTLRDEIRSYKHKIKLLKNGDILPNKSDKISYSYDILGLDPSTTTLKEIKKVSNRLKLIYHPDHSIVSNDTHFQKIMEATNILLELTTK